MEYTVNAISPVETKIDVTVPAEEVSAALAATTAIYRSRADLPGFRRGKVPASVIESKFRKQILHEAANDLINVHLNEIMSAKKYLAVAKLDVSQVELEKGNPIAYTVSFEHAPDIALPEFSGLEVDEEEAKASDEEIAQVVERIRNNLAEVKPVAVDRLPVDGDVVVVSFSAEENGQPVPGVQAENFQLTLGEGQALADFEALVKTVAPGQTKTGPVAFPQDFINQTLAGKTVDMRVTVHVIKERELPPVDDELAKKAGNFESLEKMREAIARSYVVSRQQLYKAGAQKKLLDAILSGVDFPLPPTLVQDQLRGLVVEAMERIERTGKNPEVLGKSREELEKELEPKANEMVKTLLFLLAVSDKEGLETTPQEMDAYFNQVAQRTGQDLLAVKQHYEQHNLIIQVRDKLLADKAMEFLYAKATVNKVPAKDATAPAEAADNA